MRVIVPARQATWTGGIHSLESIPEPHKNTGSECFPKPRNTKHQGAPGKLWTVLARGRVNADKSLSLATPTHTIVI
jgi:hypothetical protein